MLRRTLPILRLQRRAFTTTLSRQQQQQQQPSLHANFYKQFTRPVLKVLTLSFLTYQIVYWAWIKVENEGLKHEKLVEVDGLEKEVRDVAAGKKRRLLDDQGGKGS